MMGNTSKKRVERLEGKEIHIHLLHTGEGPVPTAVKNFLSLLPPDERQRYGSFELEGRRQEFLLSRLFARHLLAFYAGKKMSDLKFGYGPQGKPFLKGSPLQFSLSHTQDLIAFSLGCGVMGIDVEKIEDGPQGEERSELLAKRFFSPLERDYLKSLPLGLQNFAFFRIFTMKEAYAKASGSGISVLLNSLAIPLTGQEQSRQGPWEWFNRMEGDFWLSHVVENSTGDFYRHQVYEWDEVFLLETLGNVRFASSPFVNEAVA